MEACFCVKRLGMVQPVAAGAVVPAAARAAVAVHEARSAVDQIKKVPKAARAVAVAVALPVRWPAAVAVNLSWGRIAVAVVPLQQVR
jgi:hypothetical protein